jgi:hypothetical protein
MTVTPGVIDSNDATIMHAMAPVWL